MQLSTFKTAIKNKTQISFELENGQAVAPHFHLTEIGLVEKKYVDCGGKYREEKRISFQLWEANDYDHRLTSEKLLNIIEMAESQLSLPDAAIEVEYQQGTIGKFGIEQKGDQLVLTNLKTDCLAKDQCGIPVKKPKIRLSSLGVSGADQCDPSSGCC